jgi:hypothetical protein
MQLFEKDNNYLEEWLVQAEELIRLNKHNHKHKLRKSMRAITSYFVAKTATRPRRRGSGLATIYQQHYTRAVQQQQNKS